jgi:photosystem II stability/assembly factor-like uncharacterized protein
MRISYRITLLISCLCIAASAMATMVQMHTLSHVRFGSHGEILIAGSMGLLLSVDGGKNWSLNPFPLENGTLTDSAIEKISAEFHFDLSKKTELLAPMYPVMDSKGRLYGCSSGFTRIIISDNHGETWKTVFHIDESDEPSLINDFCAQIAIIADTPYVFGNAGIYWSVDRGLHWKRIQHRFAPARESSAGPFGDENGTLYVNGINWEDADKILSSPDHGATWGTTPLNFPNVLHPKYKCNSTLLRLQGNTLYFVTNCGDTTIYKSTDGKTAIKLLDIPSKNLEGQPDSRVNVNVKDIDIGPQGELAVLGDGCLYLSSDQGGRWKYISRDELMSDWILGNRPPGITGANIKRVETK